MSGLLSTLILALLKQPTWHWLMNLLSSHQLKITFWLMKKSTVGGDLPFSRASGWLPPFPSRGRVTSTSNPHIISFFLLSENDACISGAEHWATPPFWEYIFIKVLKEGTIFVEGLPNWIPPSTGKTFFVTSLFEPQFRIPRLTPCRSTWHLLFCLPIPSLHEAHQWSPPIPLGLLLVSSNRTALVALIWLFPLFLFIYVPSNHLGQIMHCTGGTSLTFRWGSQFPVWMRGSPIPVRLPLVYPA